MSNNRSALQPSPPAGPHTQDPPLRPHGTLANHTGCEGKGGWSSRSRCPPPHAAGGVAGSGEHPPVQQWERNGSQCGKVYPKKLACKAVTLLYLFTGKSTKDNQAPISGQQTEIVFRFIAHTCPPSKPEPLQAGEVEQQATRVWSHPLPGCTRWCPWRQGYKHKEGTGARLYQCILVQSAAADHARAVTKFSQNRDRINAPWYRQRVDFDRETRHIIPQNRERKNVAFSFVRARCSS
eukprot:1142841-Pelagomonas_calceolata.AAC.5